MLPIFTFSPPQTLDFGTDFMDAIWKKKLSAKDQAENKSQNKCCSNVEGEKKGSAILIQPVYVHTEVNELENIPTALIISQ